MMMDNNSSQNDPGNIGNPKDIGAFYMNRPQPLQPQKERRRFSPGLAAVVILSVFGSVVWFAYPRGGERYEGMDVPVITADRSPYKLEPVEPGGMVVPHQDSTVFAPLEGADTTSATPEQIMPQPEEPLQRNSETTGTDEGMDAEQRDASITPMPSEVPVLNLSQIEPTPKTAEVLASAPPETVKPVVIAEKIKTPEKKAVVVAKVVKTDAPAKAAAAVAPASGKTVYIQLGSFKDEPAANKAWATLKKQYLAIIGSLEPRIEKADLGVKGVFWRLQAGAVSEAEGGKICADLKAKGAGACIIAKR